MLVTNLFVKRAHGEDLEPVATFDFNENGIVNGVLCSPLRQVLVTSRPVTIECGLNPETFVKILWLTLTSFTSSRQAPSSQLVRRAFV